MRAVAFLIVGTATVSAPHALAQSAIAASDLAGLRLRNIGPASMSGRVVDMDVVESNPYAMYVAAATGGLWRTRDQATGMLAWPHSGFHVHTPVWLPEDDRAFATRLARYCASSYWPGSWCRGLQVALRY